MRLGLLTVLILAGLAIAAVARTFADEKTEREEMRRSKNTGAAERYERP